MITRRPLIHKRTKESGVVTLVTAVVLMLAVFGITYFMSETVIKDQQLAANAVRANEAFQTAQSGVEYAIAYIDASGIDDVFDLVVAASPSDLSLTAAEVPDRATVSIALSSDESFFFIKSVGISSDSSVSRTIYVGISAIPADPEQPSVPVVAKGGLDIKGNLSVTNNEESLTIWTGGEADLGGSASTYIKIDSASNQLSTSGNTRGPDVVEFDSNLANASEQELLESFYNKSSFEDFCDGSNSFNCTVSSAAQSDWGDMTNDDWDDFNEVTNSARWIYIDPPAQTEKACDDSGSFDWVSVDLADIVSSEDHPARVIINGNAQINGGGTSSTFFGVVIAKKIRVTSGFNWEGGVVATDCMYFGGGTVSFDLNKTVLEELQAQPEKVYVRGSWRDWE